MGKNTKNLAVRLRPGNGFYIFLTKNMKTNELNVSNSCKKLPFMVAYKRQGMALTILYAPQYLPSGIAIRKRKGKT
jgi:hypothetical protein